MAETPTSTANTQQRETEAQPARKGQPAVEGEQRTFAGNGAGQAATQAANQGAELAHKAAETGRQLAETGRRAGREMAESWRGTLEPFTAMQMEMNRWFEDAFRHMTGFGFFPAMRAARPFAAAGAAPLLGLPATDIRESDQAYALVIELPGLGREDVEIGLDGDVITVSGHKAEEREDATAAYRVSERRYGRFERSFPIPADVERGRIEAAFKDGLLKITLPRNAAAAPKRAKIEIH